MAGQARPAPSINFAAPTMLSRQNFQPADMRNATAFRSRLAWLGLLDRQVVIGAGESLLASGDVLPGRPLAVRQKFPPPRRWMFASSSRASKRRSGPSNPSMNQIASQLVGQDLGSHATDDSARRSARTPLACGGLPLAFAASFDDVATPAQGRKVSPTA